MSFVKASIVTGSVEELRRDGALEQLRCEFVLTDTVKGDKVVFFSVTNPGKLTAWQNAPNAAAKRGILNSDLRQAMRDAYDNWVAEPAIVAKSAAADDSIVNGDITSLP